MKNDNFTELDKSLMDEFEKVRSRKVPPETLRNFAASVESRLIAQPKTPGILRGTVPFFVIGFAGLLVFGLALQVIKMQAAKPKAAKIITEAPAAKQILKPEPSAASDELINQILLLHELGELNDKESQDLGISLEQSLAELDIAAKGGLPAKSTMPAA